MSETARILIVDDEPFVLRAHSRTLREAGYEVIEAETGNEGLRLVRETVPALILLDVVLPDVDGVEVCRRIKADASLAGCYVVLLSGLGTTSDEQALGPEVGADGYIARPISSREFLARVESILRIKSVESELRIQREWLRVTLASAADGVVATDSDGRVKFMNPVAESLTGWEQRTAQNRPVEDIFTIVDPDTGQPLEHPIRGVIEDGGAVRLDPGASLVTRDGRRVPIADSAAPITDASGEVVGVVMLFRDVTQRVQAEARRRQAEEMLNARVRQQAAVAELGQRALAGVDVATLMEGAVESVAQTLDVEYAKVLELLPGGSALLLRAGVGWNEGLVGHATVGTEKDSQAGYTLLSAEPVIVEDLCTESRFSGPSLLVEHGVVSGVSVIIQGRHRSFGILGAHTTQRRTFTGDDVRFLQAVANVLAQAIERQKAREALRESEDRYRDVVEHSHDLVCTHDLDGRIRFVNQAAVRLLGYDCDDLTSMNIRDILVPEVAGEFDEYLDGIRERGVSSGLMHVQTRTGERRIWEYDNILRVEGVEEPIVRGMAHDVTERVQTQKALRQSEARLAEAQRVGRIGNWEWNAVTGEVFWSNEVYRIFGVSPETFAPTFEGHLELIPSEDRAEYCLTIEEALSNKCPFEYEHRVLRSDGDVRTVWVRGDVPVDAEGNALGMQGTTQDITERKHAEENLRGYAERLRALRAIDGAILAAWSPREIAQAALRRLRRLVPCQGAGILTFDFEAGDVTLLAIDTEAEIGIQAGTRLPLSHGAEVEALRQGKVLVDENASVSEGGQETPPVIRAFRAIGVRSCVGVPLIAQGELIGVLALASGEPDAFTPDHVDVSRDVADQIAVGLHHGRLRAALEAEQQRLATLVEQLPEGIVWLDGERRVRLANPAAVAYLSVLDDVGAGDALTHLAGWPVDKLLEPPSEGLWHELEVAGPPRRVFEVVARQVKAEVGPDASHGTEGPDAPLRRDLEMAGWLLLMREVTVERETQRQIQQQERLAAVGQLAGGIAHDFNNLLTTVMLHADMTLGQPNLSPHVAQALEIIVDETRKAANLVRQILDFSRRSPIKTQPIDLAPFIEGAIEVLERTIPESISLRLEMEAGEHVVDADPTRIQQVLVNLVLNARDAMPGGGELRVALSSVVTGSGEPPVADMPAGEWVCLAVSDTGAGIPPDVLPHVFEPFFTTKEPGEGAGLGLAQVYGIVTQHNGHIGVDTEVGEGTTFRVYLPACWDREEALADETVLVVPEGRGETVLLVEDQERIREVGREVLESLGYRVLTAANGQEALGIFTATGDIALVITDLVMPEMGGRELARELLKRNPALKVLAITGYTMREDLADLMEEGFLGLVHKPFDMETLAEVVRQALDAG